MDVSIIIVNYNTKQLLSDCLKSIYERTKNIEFEVIVSDNGSADGSIEMLKADFPQVILIENNANLGFGAANNRGLAVAKGKYIFYLNSDTILLNNAVKMFFDFWESSSEKESIGALGCALQNSHGDTIHSGGNFPSYRRDFSNIIHDIYGFMKIAVLNKFFHKAIPEYKPQVSFEITDSIDYITGADLFLLNNEYAFFDEDFFMYNEETYLQYKLMQNGKNRLLISAPKIIHLEGMSSEKITTNIIQRELSFSNVQNRLSRILYYSKTNKSFFTVLLLKILNAILWINPILFTHAKKHIKYIFYPRKNKNRFYS